MANIFFCYFNFFALNISNFLFMLCMYECKKLIKKNLMKEKFLALFLKKFVYICVTKKLKT